MKSTGIARKASARNNRQMTKPSKPAPSDAAKQVRASEARKIKAGGRRMPGGVMPADAAEALDKLHAAGYGDTISGCIFRAIVETAERVIPPASKGRS
jgi:hypothetical protein